MKKETLIDFIKEVAEFESAYSSTYLRLKAKSILKSINEASNESLSVSDNEHGGNICPVCNGTGVREDKYVTSVLLFCLRCYGTGRI